MNCFQLVKDVLDEIYEDIKAPDDSKRNELIRRELRVLRRHYRGLLRSNTAIDYSDPATRFAYIYRYVTSHANLVSELIGRLEPIADLFDGDSIKTTCVGGGPGSDLVGILKYMMTWGKHCALTCNLFDRERAWNDSWTDVGDKLAPLFTIYVNFRNIDVTDANTWQYYRKPIKQSQLFTLTYFISELYQVSGMCQRL